MNQATILFKKGMDALPDTEVALEFFNKSADYGNINALEKIISINATERNLIEYKIAVDKLFAIASKGNIKTAKIIFNLIFEEYFADEDVSKGVKMLLYFSKSKHLESIKLAHELISEGKISDEDSTKIFDLLFMKAKNSTSIELNFMLGESFIYGWGTNKNFSAAQFWLKKLLAMENHCNNIFDQLYINIAKVYLTGNFDSEKIKTLKGYRRRAKKGEEFAITLIADIYCKGNIIAQDGYEAIKWLQKISENEKYNITCRIDALRSIAEIYRYGLGVEADGEQAIKYFEMMIDLPGQNYLTIYPLEMLQKFILKALASFHQTKTNILNGWNAFRLKVIFIAQKNLLNFTQPAI